MPIKCKDMPDYKEWMKRFVKCIKSILDDKDFALTVLSYCNYDNELKDMVLFMENNEELDSPQVLKYCLYREKNKRP